VSPEKGRSIGRFVLAAIALACVAFGGCTIRNQNSDALDVRRAGASAQSRPESNPMEGKDYDPWEPVNEKVFSFNFDLVDHYGLKPVAKLWARVLPQLLTRGLVNAFDNIEMPKRFVNNFLQGRLQGANRELTRFLVNSTLGVAGIFDVASQFGLKRAMPIPRRHWGFTASAPDPTWYCRCCSRLRSATQSDTESTRCSIPSATSPHSRPTSRARRSRE